MLKNKSRTNIEQINTTKFLKENLRKAFKDRIDVEKVIADPEMRDIMMRMLKAEVRYIRVQQKQNVKKCAACGYSL